MKKFLVIFTCLFFVCLLSGCGGNSQASVTPVSTTTQQQQATPTPTPTPKPVDGYIRTTDDSVRFLKWSEANGQINGLWSAATIQNGQPVYQNGALTGTHSGENVTLTMKYLMQEAAATGTLKGNILSLTSPGQDGKISTVEYKACSIADFNQALEAFKKKYGAGK